MGKIFYFRSSSMQKDEPKSDTTIVQVDSIKRKSEKLHYDFSES